MKKLTYTTIIEKYKRVHLGHANMPHILNPLSGRIAISSVLGSCRCCVELSGLCSLDGKKRETCSKLTKDASLQSCYIEAEHIEVDWF